MDILIALTHGAPAAGLLLGAILLVGGIGLAVAPALIERLLLRPAGLTERGDYATLVTSGFVHADIAHLVFNAFTFWAFGFGLERAIGSGRFAALYAIGLLASSIGSWLKHRHDPAYRTLGASGAILAVLFAAIVYFPTQSIFILPFPVPIPAPLFAVGYLAYTVFAAHRGRGHVNHDAHLVGALVGIVFVAFTDAPALERALQVVFG